MLRIAKRQIRRSIEAMGYRVSRAPAGPPAAYFDSLIQQAGGRRIPPKMLDPNYPGTQDLPLYMRRYGIDALLDRRFYNIGAAWNRHSCWTNVDHPSAWYANDQADNLDLAWDISKLQPIDVESSTAEAVYTSHTVEHLTDRHVEHMFAEAFRILKPGSFLRVTCPDMLLFFEAWKRLDADLFHYQVPDFSLEQLFLHEFASQLTEIAKRGTPEGAASIKVSDADIRQAFANGPTAEAFNRFTSMIDYELHKKAPGSHINWWTHEKVEQFMRRAGFTKIRRSAHKQSFCPAMRGEQFDTTHKAFSLYVEVER